MDNKNQKSPRGWDRRQGLLSGQSAMLRGYGAAGAGALAGPEERTQYGTPRSTRTGPGPGEYFRSGTGPVEPVGPTMWPSPFPGPTGALFSTESIRRLQSVQDRAPLLYGTPQTAPNRTQTPSSPGLSAEVVQAEVQRQLGPLHLQHLEHRNQQLQEQLHPTTASQQPGQPAAYDGSPLPAIKSTRKSSNTSSGGGQR